MYCVLLNGKPAVGKSTVGRAFAGLSGSVIIQNHDAIRLLSSTSPYRSAKFIRLLYDIRIALLGTLRRGDSNGIAFTLSYSNTAPEKAGLRKFMRACRIRNIKVYAVNLQCERHEMMRRVASIDRKGIAKIQSKSALRAALRKSKFCPIPTRNSLTLDTTNLLPLKAASIIFERVQNE